MVETNQPSAVPGKTSSTEDEEKKAQNVKVALRVRPTSSGEDNVATINESRTEITFRNPSVREGCPPESQRFAFDVIFPQDSSQQDLYDIVAAPVLKSALSGFNG